MRIAVSLILIIYLVLLTTPARALSCEELRNYVSQYGEAMVVSVALARGATQAQINSYRRRCAQQATNRRARR